MKVKFSGHGSARVETKGIPEARDFSSVAVCCGFTSEFQANVLLAELKKLTGLFQPGDM